MERLKLDYQNPIKTQSYFGGIKTLEELTFSETQKQPPTPSQCNSLFRF